MRLTASGAGLSCRALVIALVVASLAFAPGVTPRASAELDPAGESTLQQLFNNERAARGLPELQGCADLREVARRWSTRMAVEGGLSHNPGMTTAVQGWRNLGEIVGYDQTVDAILQRFMDSPQHRAHVLSTAYTEVGIGVERRADRVWVTAVFREPDGTAPCALTPMAAGAAMACPSARVPQAPFSDLQGNAHRGAVTCSHWYALTYGTSASQYSPSESLTRAQMATFLARLAEQAGLALPPPHDQGFTDLTGNPHADALNQLAQLGIVQGTTTSTYGPQVLVNRAQLAAALVRTYERITGTQLAVTRDWFTDDDGLVHEHAINQAADAGFIRGLTATTFGPHHSVRRDQLASFLVRALDQLVARGHLAPPV